VHKVTSLSIDLRSDTVTRPTPAMRRAMAEARVGDDVFGDDPTVNELQELVAETIGKEAALYLPSGTQSNLTALLAHCGRGDEALVGSATHVFRYEARGASVLGGIALHPIVEERDGTLDLDEVAGAVKPDDSHYPRTRLFCLENTWHGRPLPADYLRTACEVAHARGLACHLDGARLFNAAHASGVAPRELARGFDSVSLCLSKGLGAPVGSVLSGSRELIAEARRWRKMLGGGMRQAGVLAAAGRIAILEGPLRLEEDHENARRLTAGLSEIDGLEVEGPFTNMVFVHVADGDRLARLRAGLAAAGVAVEADGSPIRLVTHRDVSSADVAQAVEAFARASASSDLRSSPVAG
jgi:threonine aldolase